MGRKGLKWGSIERSGHELSRSRNFVMKIDEEGGEKDDESCADSRQADGLTLQCHPAMACFAARTASGARLPVPFRLDWALCG